MMVQVIILIGIVSAAVVMALALILAPSAMSENAFAKNKYKNWCDCREDQSKNWCKKYFKKHNHDNNKKSGGNNANQGIGI